MDPRQLLDPKGFAREKPKKKMPNYGPQQYRKTNPSDQSTLAPKPALYDPNGPLNSHVTTTHPPASPSSNLTEALDSTHDDSMTIGSAETDAEQAGLGNLIERMHGVTNREDAPFRKRKSAAIREDSDDEEPNKKAKATFTSASKGGIVSSHMKAEREKTAAKAGPPDIVIDLTNDAEGGDDVQFLKEKINDEICMGTFAGKVHMHRLPAVRRSAMGSVGKEFWPPTKLEYRRHAARDVVVNLFDHEKNFVGTLDQKLGSTLCPVLDRADTMKFRLKIMLQARRRKALEVSGARVSEYHSVILWAYIKLQYADAIGKHFSQKGIFLSTPPANSGAEFYNPQEPKPLGQLLRNPERRPQNSQTIVSRTAEEMRRDADSMFDNLFKQEDLVEKDVDPAFIATPLLTHQKQGLHFLTMHEQADQDDVEGRLGLSLWKHNIHPNGRQHWYNIITGLEVDKKPSAARGGILADMMGLGKTLSILALIADTHAQSLAFGREEPPPEIVDIVARNVKCTLIICPKSVLSNWDEQVKAHVKPGKFRVYCYHGQSRTQDVDELAKYELILTTYQTAASEFHVKNRALAAVNWFRIVLDEAHQIRNPATQVSKACCALLAQRRWAVTGTPVQNGLNDLGALVRFLHIKPFNEGINWAQYIMAPFKNADVNVLKHLQLLVQSITLRRLKDRVDLCGRVQEQVRIDFTPEERKVYEKVAGDVRIKFSTMTGGGKERLRGKSYAHILKSIGQMRAICAHNLDMFPEEERKEIQEGIDPDNAIPIDLGDEPGDAPDNTFITEKQAYDHLNMAVASDANGCMNCDRLIGEQTAAAEPSEEDDNDDDDDDDDDATSDSEVTLDDSIGYITPCYHLICTKCKDKYLAEIEPTLTADKRHPCSICPAGVFVRYGLFKYTNTKLKEMNEAKLATTKGRKGRNWDEASYSGPSTKVRALINDLKQSEAETALLPLGQPPVRSVVFSGWTQYLDLIEVALDEAQMGHVRLDGSLSLKARRDVLETFKTDPAISVLLVSIKAGGQGLNLTAASKVYMMEPQFNPGVEEQAIDRVHRLGQTRDVHIRHYIMRDSVEDGILKLQEKKKALATLSMERRSKLSTDEQAKTRLEDLRDLFK